MKKKTAPETQPTQEGRPDAKDLAVGIRFVDCDAEPGTYPMVTPEDLKLVTRLGFQFLVWDLDLEDLSTLETGYEAAQKCPVGLSLYAKIRILPNLPPERISEPLARLAGSSAHTRLQWLLDPGGTELADHVSVAEIADQLRAITPSCPVGLWCPWAVFLPDDPESPWDTRAAQRAAAGQLDAVPDPESFDFLALVWQGRITLRFSPFRPLSGWHRIRHIHPPDPADAAFFIEALSMTAALRRPMLVVDSSPAPLRTIPQQAVGHCAGLGAFFRDTAGTASLLGYCWSPLLDPTDGGHAVGSRTGLVLLDPADGSRTPHPEAFRWTALCRQAFREALTKGTAL